MKKTLIASLLVMATLTACSMTPDYDRPQVSAMERWKARDKVSSADINPEWWRNFNSVELDALMIEALQNNNDLGAALARIKQAQASAKIAGASLLPSVDGTGGAGWSRSIPHGGSDKWSNSASAGVSVSYELDLFGANRAGIAAAKAGVKSSVYDHDALSLVVMSDVAQTYFSLLNLRERVQIAQNNLKNERDVMQIVQARYDAGSSNALDVSRQKAQLATQEAAVAALQNQANAAQDALAILLGKAPSALRTNGMDLKKVKLPKVPLSQPSVLLERRPDIRAAEENLVAANADIGAARAAFFPTFDIGSAASLALSPIGGAATKGFSITSSLLAPIFHGGALEGGVEKATGREMELAEVYRKTVLTSLQEVEDALSAANAAQTRQKALLQAMRESRKSYQMSRELYKAGSVDYQSLLDAQRTLLSAEDSYASVKLESLDAAVTLYKALGGGWIDLTPPAKKK
ncbi:MAG: efflux transporter outer membrane subunit [Alphaproteobacteria bacterium]|nr:efflux transporter outer membrane subunit [Alphaproteobacteria bacterium]